MKKYLVSFLMFGAILVPDAGFSNVKFTKDDSAVLAEAFEEEFGDNAGAATDTFEKRHDKDKGIDADGMAEVYAAGSGDASKKDVSIFKKFWTAIVGKKSRSGTSGDCIQVESDNVCIPANPCVTAEYAKYCNKEFKNLHGMFLQNYQLLVDSYAKSHKLSCSFKKVDPVNNETKLALCSGKDVMVFEFSTAEQDECHSYDAVQAWCIASNGELSRSKERCSSKACDSAIQTIAKQYNDSSDCKYKKTINLKYNRKDASCTLRVYDDSDERALYYRW